MLVSVPSVIGCGNTERLASNRIVAVLVHAVQ